MRVVRPEKLKFYYTSWNVGLNNAGSGIKLLLSLGTG
jgi:hypothetical protein